MYTQSTLKQFSLNGLSLTMPYATGGCIWPFNILCDKQITITLKWQPGVTLVVVFIRIFRANSWEGG